MILTDEEKGRRAKEILADEVFLFVVSKAKEDILTRWSLTSFDSVDTRESLYHQGQALNEILRGLRVLVDEITLRPSRNKTKQGHKQ